MQLPNIIEERLRTDYALAQTVDGLLAAALPVLTGSGMCFFPEYTEHGVAHAEHVLASACSLMNDAALSQFSALDAGLLTIACFSHDLAMHLTEDGFLRLMQGNEPNAAARAQDLPWKELWERFFGEIQRYDSRRLVSLFGDSEAVREPPGDPLEFTLRDRLLIGEFIRRWHHRMAHEFLLRGFPGPLGCLPLVAGDERVINLAGLVARSHGVSIRDLLPDLKGQYSLRSWRNSHPVFLMVLLRTADYLHIEPNRAPGALLRIKALRSPVSQREWAINQAIDDVRQAHEDPEAVEVDSFPSRISEYRRMKEWLSSFQGELDASWAVLGETYGRYSPQNQLGILIRRVRSNLDDREAFETRASFVPRVAKFEAAGADLLKLLVKPLYGNRPQFAIRELVQNAVDAVRERRALAGDQEILEPLPDLDLDGEVADVVVSVDPGEGDEIVVSVSDNGVGMTVDTICDYFLKIGASLRQSEAWRTHFEQEEGKSVVLRSGRFGIGVLAAFILGDEIEVVTRHVSSPSDRAVHFRSRIDQEEVDLRWTTARVGTTIRIRVAFEMAERLIQSDWDWYCLNDPRVVRRVGPALLPQAYGIPSPHEPAHHLWRRIEPEGFEAVLWSYTAAAPLLTCNGLTVIRSGHVRWRAPSDSLRLMMPRVSVFDPDGHLPLTILRNELSEAKLPFEAALFEDVLLDLLAYVVARGPIASIRTGNMAQYCAPRYPGLAAQRERSLYVATKRGFVLFESALLHALGIDRVVLSAALGPRGPLPEQPIPTEVAQAFQYVPDLNRSWARTVETLVRTALEKFAGARVITTEKDDEHDPRLFFGSEEFGSLISLENRMGGTSIWRVGSCPERDALTTLVTKHADQTRRIERARARRTAGAYAILYDPKPAGNDSSRLGEVWRRTLGPRVVPFALTERKALLDAVLPGLFERYGARVVVEEEEEEALGRSDSWVDGSSTASSRGEGGCT